MKKTVFVGKVNDQEFDNVQDYNACVQAMLDMGKDFQATSSTQVVEVPDEDTCKSECTCEQCTCGKDTSKKNLLPATKFLPAYEKRCDGGYIDEFISIEKDEDYEKYIDMVDEKLNKVYDEVVEAKPRNTPEQIEVYSNAVNCMVGILNKDYKKTSDALDSTEKKIEELEAELEPLYMQSNRLNRAKEVIHMYTEFYNAIQNVMSGKENSEEPESNVHNTIVTPRSFMDFLNEIFGNK